MAFLGEVKPTYGRWVWPYKAMEPGDYFIVDKNLLSGEDLRHRTSVRAAQLGLVLKVTTQDEEHPGFTKVTRPNFEEEAKRKGEGKLMDGQDVRTFLMNWYGYDLHQLPAGELYHKGGTRVNQPQIEEPSVERLLFDYPGSGRLGVLFDKDGFTVKVMRESETIKSWKHIEPSLDDVMS